MKLLVESDGGGHGGQWNGRGFLEADALWNVEGGVGGRDGILGIAAVRVGYDVERSDTVSGLELVDFGSNFVDVAGMVVTGV